MNKKIRGLLLQVEVMEGSEIKVLNENTFEVDGAEYLVLTEDEKIVVFTKGFFVLIINKDNNLVTAYQSRPSKYKKYFENSSK